MDRRHSGAHDLRCSSLDLLLALLCSEKLGLFCKEQHDSREQQEGLMGGTSRPRRWATSAVLDDLQLVTQPLCLCMLLRRRLLKPWVSTLLGNFTHW